MLVIILSSLPKAILRSGEFTSKLFIQLWYLSISFLYERKLRGTKEEIHLFPDILLSKGLLAGIVCSHGLLDGNLKNVIH